MAIYNEIGLKVGGTYTRQKIRIALCKIYRPSAILEIMETLDKKQYTQVAQKSPMCDNLDTITILKDFTL